MVRAVVAGLTAGKLVRPWFGASTQQVTAELALSLGLPRPLGVIVREVYRGGPTDQAGLRTGDVITEVNGRPVLDPEGLAFRIATLTVGNQARLRVLRRGTEREVRLSLKAAPEVPLRNVTRLSGQQPFSGATVANLSPALAEELSIDPIARGVIVLEVRRRSVADRLGVEPGDIVLGVNDEEIATVDALARVLKRRPTVWRLSIRRGERVINVSVRG